jgi:hypothetical protein
MRQEEIRVASLREVHHDLAALPRELKSNVEVVRRGLRLLREDTDRRALREAYRKASRATARFGRLM